MSRTKFIGLVSQYRSGEYLDVEKFKSVVEFSRCREAKLEFESEQSICIDGELFEGKTFALKVLPRALKIIIPKGSAFSKDETKAPAAFVG